MVYVNISEKLLKKGGRKAPLITLNILKEKLEKLAFKYDSFEAKTFSEARKELDEMWEDGFYPIFEILNGKLEKDLKKVEFDLENFTTKPDAFVDSGGDLVGFHTLDNGFSFLGCLGGGDWESPVFFIIYDDGKSLRGYIPLCGNAINRLNKSAFGNGDFDGDEDIDETFLKEECGRDVTIDELIEFHWEWIEKDIKSRIEMIS